MLIQLIQSSEALRTVSAPYAQQKPTLSGRFIDLSFVSGYLLAFAQFTSNNKRRQVSQMIDQMV